MIEWLNESIDSFIAMVLTGNVIYSIVKIIIIYVIAKIAIRLLQNGIERVFQVRQKNASSLSEKRSETLTKLLQNVVVYVIWFIAILMIIIELGFNPMPLLAGAGVLGLAIGFGAQNLVRDMISGFFIIYEDQFAVGDFITTGNYSGTVQEIGLRVTKIKEWTGQVHVIPNGQINEVTNFSKENSMAVLDLGIAYEENISRVEQVLEQILHDVFNEEENIVEQPTIIGIQDLADSEVVIRIAAECSPMTHWGVVRKLRRVIKDRFDEQGIEIPYPRMVTYRREE